MTFGVVVPFYNRQEVILDTLRAIHQQERRPDKVILVDDGSSDNTLTIVENWLKQNKLNHYFEILSQKNQGVSVARNRGAQELKDTKYLSFLDSDDIWPSDFVSSAISAFRKADKRLALWSRCQVFYSSEKKTVKKINLAHLDGVDPAIKCCFFNKKIPLLSSTVIKTKHHFKAGGGFREGMLTGQDRDWALRLARNGYWLVEEGVPVKIRRNDTLIKRQRSDHLSELLTKDPEWISSRPFSYEMYLLENPGCPSISINQARKRLTQVWLVAGSNYLRIGYKREARWCYERAARIIDKPSLEILKQRLKTIGVKPRKPSGWLIERLPEHPVFNEK